MSGHGRGDAAFDRWYLQHFDRIRVLCSRILRDASQAEDMAQEALLRAWMRRDQMREEDLGAWLSVVARNLCLSAIRRDGRLVITDEVPEHADLRADPAAEVVRRESRRNVRRALGKLGDRNRRVIYLREIHEQEYEDIGSEFGVSAEGARTIAFRARRVLKEHLAAVGEGFSGVLVGVRVRIRSVRARIRDSWSGLEAGAVPALQGGLNAVLAVGLALSVGAGDLAPSLSRDTRSRAMALAPTAQVRANSPAGSFEASVPPASALAPAGKGGKGLVPLSEKPDVVAAPWDEDQKSEIAIKYGDFIIFRYRRGPTEDDGLEGVRHQVDVVVGVLCESETVCDFVHGG